LQGLSSSWTATSGASEQGLERLYIRLRPDTAGASFAESDPIQAGGKLQPGGRAGSLRTQPLIIHSFDCASIMP